VTYLLDTNACIALIEGRPPQVRARLAGALKSSDEVLVSAIAAFELWYGVAKSVRPEANASRVATFFAGPVAILPFDDEDAESAGAIRAAAEKAGRPIGPYDLLMAGQALRRNLTLVTSNAREFRRVRGLAWEDWARK
jgi:tRNA(fMet)-specific endonuclease VapC